MPYEYIYTWIYNYIYIGYMYIYVCMYMVCIYIYIYIGHIANPSACQASRFEWRTEAINGLQQCENPNVITKIFGYLFLETCVRSESRNEQSFPRHGVWYDLHSIMWELVEECQTTSPDCKPQEAHNTSRLATTYLFYPNSNLIEVQMFFFRVLLYITV